MKYLMSFLFFVSVSFGSASAISLPSKNFFKRGLQHCTGHCDSKNIKCKKGTDKQGYYDWCKKNCLHSSKKDRQSFLDAIAMCDSKGDKAPGSEGGSDALPEFTESYLGKIVDGDRDHGFKVLIVAQKESGDVARSGENVFLHNDKTSEGMKIGDYIQMNNISSKELPAFNFGRMKLIKDRPEIVK